MESTVHVGGQHSACDGVAALREDGCRSVIGGDEVVAMAQWQWQWQWNNGNGNSNRNRNRNGYDNDHAFNYARAEITKQEI